MSEHPAFAFARLRRPKAQPEACFIVCIKVWNDNLPHECVDQYSALHAAQTEAAGHLNGVIGVESAKERLISAISLRPIESVEKPRQIQLRHHEVSSRSRKRHFKKTFDELQNRRLFGVCGYIAAVCKLFFIGISSFAELTVFEQPQACKRPIDFRSHAANRNSKCAHHIGAIEPTKDAYLEVAC